MLDFTTTNEEIENPKTRAKLKHVHACLREESQYRKTAGFDAIELEHDAAAGLSLHDISLATDLLGVKLAAPLMIAPMTGGMELGALLNRRWARAAEHFGLAFGVGSQRLMLMDERVSPSFNVRAHAPTALIFANLGAAQILTKEGPSWAERAVSSIAANALFLHLNPLQEACQENGDTDMTGLLDGIARVVAALKRQKIPVFVREVGFGLSESAAKALIETGIDGLDCAGAGGTSWTKVEALCSTDETYVRMGQVFGEWGIPTVSSIKNVRTVSPTIPLIATGGLRTGLDIAKALSLGANIGAMAQPMLRHAMTSEEALFGFIEQVLRELRLALFACGKRSVLEFAPAPAPAKPKRRSSKGQ